MNAPGSTAPAGSAALHLQGVDRSTPCLLEFASTAAGQTAGWAGRWGTYLANPALGAPPSLQPVPVNAR